MREKYSIDNRGGGLQFVVIRDWDLWVWLLLITWVAMGVGDVGLLGGVDEANLGLVVL